MIHHTAILLLLAVAQPAVAGDWKFLSNRDGVSTFSQEVPDSKLLGFRGESVVDVPRMKLLGAMLDERHTQEWVDLLMEHRPVEGDGVRQVIYQRYDMAWPVADRDMVLERVVQHWPDKGLTTVTIRSVAHPSVPPIDGVVRAEVSRSWFALSDEAGGRTRVEVEAFTDPKGIVPQWLVNLVQKTWARNSINALVRVAKPEQSAAETAPTW